MRSVLCALAVTIILILSFNKLVYDDMPVANATIVLTEVNRHKQDVKSILMTDSNFSDLSFFDAMLKNNRILMLGEMMHNDGETFKAKARIIRYLHEQLDYNVVLYEAGQYDMWMMNAQMDTLMDKSQEKTIGGTGLFDFWWQNQENQPLLTYYKKTKSTERPMILGGFDIQFSGRGLSNIRVKLLEDFLLKNGIDSTKYPLLKKNSNRLEYLTYEPFASKRLNANEKKQFLAELDELNRRILSGVKDSEHLIYSRYLSDMKHNFDKSWRYKTGSMQSMHFRDSLMAENLTYQIDSLYAGKKIIVWCANIHSFSAPYNKDYRPLGTYLKRKYGAQAYSLDFTSYGRYDKTGRVVDRVGKLAVENVFHATKLPYFFLDLRELSNNSILKQNFSSVINQGIDEDRRWHDFIDGIFYIDINKDPIYR
ncbi:MULTISPECIES: erythromycin esterase family protein [Sphingobacterium]|uniref:erythromycin esterase family protein n=1 Tax=Sphingobacterium TaxID=28453 RepID=UPI002579B50C|nr:MULTISPECIES: erythromycin esterase family protein [Sphingobacterium]